MDTITRWSPGDYLGDQAETVPSFGLIILNQPIGDGVRFTKLWNNAKLRVCADGGANHLHSLRIDGDIPIPDCITGDLDSLKPEVEDYYRARGVSIVPDTSQYATDFTKSLNWIYGRVDLNRESATDLKSTMATTATASSNDSDDTTTTAITGGSSSNSSAPHDDANPKVVINVVAYGATGGRVDQAFHSIHQLFQASQDGQNTRSRRRVTLMSDESVTFLLEKGRNIIDTPLRLFGKTCGLIPVAGPSIITTKGLEWNLENTETRFGGMVSTNNHLMEEEVEITTTELLLFTMEIRRA
ncbi:hypothetical protein ABW19_dt0209533 [Dactylella cylindrospora]|nr:hypothetical protein ABW19_dt0209533 [Dactylella cylindrospora]